MTDRRIDRTRIVATQRCPRSRWWGWEQQNPQSLSRGLEPLRLGIPLATGGAVHQGLAIVLNGQPVEVAVGEAKKFLMDLAASRGLMVEEDEDVETAFREQLALTEALVRLAHLRVVPQIKATLGQPLPEWTEKEISRELAPGILMMARPDGLLITPSIDGLPAGHLVVSWKTAASYDKRKDSDARVDMQGLSEAWVVEAELGQPITGVVMIYLIKGRRLPDKRLKGKWDQHSPLVRGWKKSDGFTTNYAWTYEWTEEDPECGGQVTRRLGKGWVPFSVWQEMGVAAWMEMLNSGQVQPEAGDCLGRQYVIPVPYYRQARDMDRWVRQTRAQEERIARNLRVLEDWPFMEEEVLANTFPLYTHSCSYPSQCNFHALCWGPSDIAQDPLNSGLYQVRVPNHPESED